MEKKWAVPRRTFLEGLGTLAGLSASQAEFITQTSATPADTKSNLTPNFGGSDQLQPHILTWGGNALFIRSKGIEKTTHAQRREAILSTHPEAFWAQGLTGFDGPPSEGGAIASRVRGELELARDLGFETPFGRAGLFSYNHEDDWYESLDSEEKWRWPDGTPLESHMEAGMRSPDGSMVKLDMDECEGDEGCRAFDIVPSIHVDGVEGFYGQMATDYVGTGTIGIWLDQLDIRGRHRDFSPWARRAFQEHLQELSDANLDRLGIEDPEGLNVREEILNRTPRNSGSHPAEDPLYREYTKFDFQSTKEFLSGLRERLATEYPERDPDEFILFGNLYGPFENPHTAAILSDPLTLPAGESQETIPPNNIFDFNVKFYVAAGRFNQSGFHQGRPYLLNEDKVNEVNQLDKAEPQPDYCSIQFAEQVANRAVGVATFQGSCCHGPIQDQPGNWIRPDGTIPDELEELTGFAWSTRELLRGGQFTHDVAVVRSIPTNLWEASTWDWNRSNEAISESFAGASNLVMETDRPYDVLIFGHPDLWDDSVMLDRLSTYEQVILPSTRCLSEAQADSLVDALEQGLHVIFSDETPRHDADYELLSDETIEELVTHRNSTVLSGTPSRDYWNGDGDGTALKQALSDRPQLVSTDTDTNLELTLQTQSDPGRIVLQAVNYGLDLESGDVSSISNLSVTVRNDFDIEIQQATYYRPGKEPETLNIEHQNDHFEITLPELDVWGVLVVGPDAEATSLAGSESTATEVIAAADEEIATTDAEGQTDNLGNARQFQSYAETGVQYNAFDRAEEAAGKALETAKAASNTPTVGIDIAHNQPEAKKGFDALEGFRGSFVRDIEFVAVDEWTEEVFDELDVLMVPSPVEFEGHLFEFAEQEVKLAEDFVNRGGGLLFLGTNGVPWDHTDLLGKFDAGFKPGVVRNPDGYGASSASRRETNEINQTTLNLEGTGPAPAVNPPDDATVLYEYPTSEDIWRDRCDSSSSQNCKPDAGGDPFSTIFSRGSGTVMIHATDYHLKSFSLNGRFTEPWSPTINVLRNAIYYMAGGGKRTEGPNKNSTTTGQSTTTANDSGKANQTTGKTKSMTTAEGSGSDNQATGTNTPGFGILSGLAAFGGGAYLLDKFTNNND